MTEKPTPPLNQIDGITYSISSAGVTQTFASSAQLISAVENLGRPSSDPAPTISEIEMRAENGTLLALFVASSTNKIHIADTKEHAITTLKGSLKLEESIKNGAADATTMSKPAEYALETFKRRAAGLEENAL